MGILDRTWRKLEWATGISSSWSKLGNCILSMPYYYYPEYRFEFFFIREGHGSFRLFNFDLISVSLEVEMISRARNMGFLTTPYAFNPEEAAAMAKVGAHIIVAHMGLTTAGSIGAKTAVTLDDSAVRVQAIADAALRVNPDIIVLSHGGTLLIFYRPVVDALL
jgi:hypothetical protein